MVVYLAALPRVPLVGPRQIIASNAQGAVYGRLLGGVTPGAAGRSQADYRE